MILLDYDFLINNNINPKIFKSYSKLYPNKKNYKRGLIMFLDKNIYQKLMIKDISLRRNILHNLNDDQVIDVIPILIENNKKRISFFQVDELLIKNLSKVIELCFQNLPHDYNLMIILDLKDKHFDEYSKVILKYFSYPIIKDLKMQFYKPNNDNDNIDIIQSSILFEKLLDNFMGIMDPSKRIFICQIYVKINKKGIEKLKSLNSIIFEDKDKFTGFEISNKFEIYKIEDFKNYPLITLTLDDTLKNVGNSDTVDVVYSKYTFHTHPRRTYDKFQVKFAWPSWQDFESFIVLFKSNFNIFHVVSTLEGAYILKINPIVMKDLENLSNRDLEKICEKFYSIPYLSYKKEKDQTNEKLPQNPQDFCILVNKKRFKYKNKEYPPFFEVEFYDWKNLKENTIIKLSFFSEGINCPVSDIQNI